MTKHKRYHIAIAIMSVCFSVLFFTSLFFFFYLQDRHKAPTQTSELTSSRPKYKDAPVVIIDAGHGGEDGGAIGVNGVYEKDLNLSIALELEQMLSSAGITTRLTRDSDILLYDTSSDYKGHKKAQDAAARVAIGNEYENAVFISIHMNSFTESKYSGLQVYYSESSPLSATLAEYVQSTVIRELQSQNTRKIKPSNKSIYVLDKSKHPAILIECGFISNPTECDALCTPAYRRRLCTTLYFAIIEYLENTAVTT